MQFTRSEENYLKAIFHLSDQGVKNVNTNALASRLHTKASSVTDMLKKLSDKALVDYMPYKGVKLTDKGRKGAISVVRKHRLWEFFLVDKLNFSWDEVHDVAEQLEHVKSEKLIAELDAFLGFPTHDPHGDPIPDETGQFKSSRKVLLSETEVGSICFCVGVVDSSARFLKYLDNIGIALGTQLKVVSKEAFDNSMVIKTKGNTMTLSEMITKNLYVIIN